MDEKDKTYPEVEVFDVPQPSQPLRITWKVYEKRGTPVYDSLAALHDGRPVVELPPEGTEVIVSALVGYCRATISGGNAETEHFIWMLEFDQEDKHWISIAMINKACLERLPSIIKGFHE